MEHNFYGSNFPEVGVLDTSSRLPVALGVSKFITIIAINLEKLFFALVTSDLDV